MKSQFCEKIFDLSWKRDLVYTKLINWPLFDIYTRLK